MLIASNRLLPILALLGLPLLTACGDQPNDTLSAGNYAVLQINDQTAPSGITFDLDAQGRISGQAPCNRFMAQLERSGKTMSVSPVAATRMACMDPARSRAETDFLAALGAIAHAAPGTVPGQVELRDATGTRLLLGPAGE